MKEMFEITNKVAIVTGASKGLGKAMAIGLAKAGANIVATDVLDVSDTVKEIKKIGKQAIAFKTDVSKKQDVEKMVKQTMEKFGKIDILVNNAGILRMGNAETMKQEDWNKVIQVNLTGQFLCAQAVAKQMIKQK